MLFLLQQTTAAYALPNGTACIPLTDVIISAANPDHYSIQITISANIHHFPANDISLSPTKLGHQYSESLNKKHPGIFRNAFFYQSLLG